MPPKRTVKDVMRFDAPAPLTQRHQEVAEEMMLEPKTASITYNEVWNTGNQFVITINDCQCCVDQLRLFDTTHTIDYFRNRGPVHRWLKKHAHAVAHWNPRTSSNKMFRWECKDCNKPFLSKICMCLTRYMPSETILGHERTAWFCVGSEGTGEKKCRHCLKQVKLYIPEILDMQYDDNLVKTTADDKAGSLEQMKLLCYMLCTITDSYKNFPATAARVRAVAARVPANPPPVRPAPVALVPLAGARRQRDG